MPHCTKEHYSPEPGAVIKRASTHEIPKFLKSCEFRTVLMVLLILAILKRLKML